MKILCLVIAMFFASVIGAFAQGYTTNQNAGRCPPGTYAKGGGDYANNIKNCSAANKSFAERFGEKAKK